MQLSDRFTTADDVVTREVGGEMVLLDLTSGQYFGLDAIGAKIWEWLSEAALTLGELCDRIEAEFDAPRAQIESDLLYLVGQMHEQALIQPAAD